MKKNVRVSKGEFVKMNQYYSTKCYIAQKSIKPTVLGGFEGIRSPGVLQKC